MRREAGFSLLELVAVLSIFALVSLIGVQVIQATVRSSTRLAEVSENSKEVSLAMALLRQDMNAALGRVFTPPNGGTEPALKAGPGTQFSLTVGGLAGLQPNSSGQGRVIWRLDRGSGRLMRRVITSLTPGDNRAPEVAVLSDVQSMDLFSFQAQSGWQPGFAGDPREPAALPLGLRVRIDLARVPGLEAVVSLR